MGINGCGNAAVPNPMAMDAQPTPMADAMPDVMRDAMPVDACTCQSAGSNIAARITHRPFQTEIFDTTGVNTVCIADSMMPLGELLGGSYILEPGPSEDDAAITWVGVWFPDIPMLGEQQVLWGGGIRAFASDENNQMIATAACLDTSVEAGAQCATQLDVAHEVEYASISPGGVIDASARCERGMLVGGGCSTDAIQRHRARVLRAGMDPTDPSRWLCSWRSHDAAEDIAVSAQVFCLEEIIPESCGCCPPLGDSIVVKQETQPFGPGTNRLQVTCEPGELLLLGNCMLDTADTATLANVTMFRFGFYPGDDDTWGCSWKNPDAITATATATALCLPP
jgi:hypothetical protein